MVIFLSGFLGWSIERLCLNENLIPAYIRELILIIAISSGLAAKSLNKGVKDLIETIPIEFNNEKIDLAKKKLKFLVGRDVEHMNKLEIVRAAAETASENAIDGIFAPLFWMFIGIFCWKISTNLPGPLSLIWIFKASSTIDSMIGYKEGSLKWLGTAGAFLDDLLTWIPCRVVLITLPLICRPLKEVPYLIKKSNKEGLQYESPNAGVSQAIYANCLNIRLGGINIYNGKKKLQPTIGSGYNSPSIKSIYQILVLTYKLEFLWLLIASILLVLMDINYKQL